MFISTIYWHLFIWNLFIWFFNLIFYSLRYLERLVLIKFNDGEEETEIMNSKTEYLLLLLLQSGDCTGRDMRLAIDEILKQSTLTNRRDMSNMGSCYITQLM